MTNKQERYFVVSESELYWALDTARMAEAYHYERMEQAADEAEAACRARPVPEWATHFAERVRVGMDGDETEYEIQNIQEIKK